MADFCRELEACLAEEQGATQVIAPAMPPRTRKRRRSVSPWPFVLVLAALIAIGAVIAALALTSGTGVFSIHHSSTGGTGNGAPVHLDAITAYDPFGSPPGQEHNAEAPRATDNNGGTYWETEHYDGGQLNKAGVGLVLDAGHAVALKKLGIATGTPGFTAVIRAGDSPGSFPATVSSSQTVSSGTQFTLAGGPHRYYLLWITALPPGGNTVQINEVKAAT
jgi:hypothetical protein